jgi:competence CoiA-like predicted nuclease
MMPCSLKVRNESTSHVRQQPGTYRLVFLAAKMEVFLELYGNIQIRQRTQVYVNEKVKAILR